MNEKQQKSSCCGEAANIYAYGNVCTQCGKPCLVELDEVGKDEDWYASVVRNRFPEHCRPTVRVLISEAERRRTEEIREIIQSAKNGERFLVVDMILDGILKDMDKLDEGKKI